MAAGDFYASQLALIKSARSLESDSRPFDDKIKDVWRLLTAAKGGKSCAAEETILRWLLKHMDGNTDIAEQIRRYPLTWTTIGCLFERISLFSLSRIFLERKFVIVLQQSAKDISNPAADDASKATKPKKRKRDQPITFDIDSLRAPETLISSASELFGALGMLLRRVDATSIQDSEDIRIGAEHVKSLFRMPVEDVKDLIAPLVWICARSMSLLPLHGGLHEQQEQWPKILIALWNLHLGSMEDARIFATHLYYPCCTIIDQLSSGNQVQGHLDRKQSWKRQFEQFILKNLINPARNSFANGLGLGLLDIANATASKEPALCIRVLWRLAAQKQHDVDDPTSKRARQAWAQAVFKLLLAFAEEHKVAESVTAKLLSEARFYGCSPELETLTYLTKSYCFQSSETDWDVLADVISCDADVFLLNEELLNTLLGRITSSTKGDKLDLQIIVENVVNSLMEAFAKARDLTGFTKRWHAELCQMLDQKTSLESTPWIDRRICERFAGLMQGALSTQQASALVDWLQMQDDKGAHLVILDAIGQGAKDEAYISALSSKLLNTVLQKVDTAGRPPFLLSIKWRITKTTASWVSAAETHTIWKHTKTTMSKVLSSQPLSETATFEAFDCCSQLCSVNYPMGQDLSDAVTMASAFLKRIIAEVKLGHIDTNYLELVFSKLPPLSSAPNGDEQIGKLLGELHTLLQPQAVQPGFSNRIAHKDVIADDEGLVDSMIEPLIAELEASGSPAWTAAPVESPITRLLEFAPDAFAKDRRKRIMSSWKKWESDINAHAAKHVESYKLILRLLILVMSQPTFYDGMDLDDIRNLPLVSTSGALLYVDKLAQLVISQVIGNPEASPSYFKQIVQFVAESTVDEESDSTIPLILLKSILAALKRSPPKAKQTLKQDDVVNKLRGLVSHSISEFSSKLKKPGKLAKDEDSLVRLDLTLRAAADLGDSLSANPIKLSSKVASRLQDAGEILTSQGIPVGWKLQTFLALNQHDSSSAALLKQMSQDYAVSPDNQSIGEFVVAVTRTLDAPAKLGLLHAALKSTSTWKSSNVPYMIVARIIETIQVSESPSIIVDGDKNFDLASVQVILVQSLADKNHSLERFRYIAQVIEQLLDKHSSSMTQINIELTLAAVSAVCSVNSASFRNGNEKDDDTVADVAERTFDILCRLTATIVKRHRLRLEGHHHLLVSALQDLLRVLLAKPADSNQSSSSFLFPPWLDTRLRAQHGTKFARLLTLICEPSAASVARGKNNSLDSVTDAVKRSAGQHMFWILALYIKLQLEGDVSRDMRKELTTGIYSILSITPEASRRILSEAMDESGRAIFRTIFTEWKKFGKWTGV
ncbi:hypothetical protein PFICI_12461 [Pestalotiopsis fici W106-1]|uniref:Nucleolar 27S pre-rRNA processing Urb2/Npa2 C-terminal domain-containing protein n=1 Tax=Pestalotiopsis fici (strain W106-1 / CGMCC3.15140) TaxID=1229662 RepID=W3WQT4_PESFW|nr:uncharacterized protein PFICI_12461 [Pestalotiopsis fici W106-1]ETS75517.1 hypothetical protein PFICI_12461 [Pestalotiopsis fici W106-1]